MPVGVDGCSIRIALSFFPEAEENKEEKTGHGGDRQ